MQSHGTEAASHRLARYNTWSIRSARSFPTQIPGTSGHSGLINQVAHAQRKIGVCIQVVGRCLTVEAASMRSIDLMLVSEWITAGAHMGAFLPACHGTSRTAILQLEAGSHACIVLQMLAPSRRAQVLC